jgi:hypothetical protein
LKTGKNENYPQAVLIFPRLSVHVIRRQKPKIMNTYYRLARKRDDTPPIQLRSGKSPRSKNFFGHMFRGLSDRLASRKPAQAKTMASQCAY